MSAGILAILTEGFQGFTQSLQAKSQNNTSGHDHLLPDSFQSSVIRELSAVYSLGTDSIMKKPTKNT